MGAFGTRRGLRLAALLVGAQLLGIVGLGAGYLVPPPARFEWTALPEPAHFKLARDAATRYLDLFDHGEEKELPPRVMRFDRGGSGCRFFEETVVTPGTRTLLLLEGFRAEEECLAASFPHTIAGVETLGKVDGKRRVLVRAGRELLVLVEEETGWLVDRVLAIDETAAHGIALRLPARLHSCGDQPDICWGAFYEVRKWRSGDLTVRLGRNSSWWTPDYGDVEREGVSIDSWHEMKIEGRNLRLFFGTRWKRSLALAFIEYRPCEEGALPIRYEIDGPPGRVAELEWLMRKSLETLRVVEPETTPR